MGFWPDVKRGDPVRHHMLLENDLRHMVNALSGFSDRPNGRTVGSVVRVRIWNAGENAIKGGQPVMFDHSKDACGDAFPAIPCTEDGKFYGVCEDYLKPGAIGECVIAGAVGVSTTGGTAGNYAAPSADGTMFVRGDAGVPILYANTALGAVICLGAAPAVSASSSHAPFRLSFNGGTAGTATVDVAPGFASRNGEAVFVPAGTVDATASGYVALRAPFSDSTGWGAFEYVVLQSGGGTVTITDADYPVGWVTVSGGTVSAVESFTPPMAVFIKAGTCDE